MGHFNKHLLLIVSLSSLLFLANAVPATRSRWPRPTHVRLLNLCRSTTNPNLCFQTINPQIRGRFNYYKALEAEVLATEIQVKKTAGTIAALLAKPGNPKSLSDSFSTCQKLYEDIQDAIVETKKWVTQRNAEEARFKFSAVLTYRVNCDDEFKGNSSPLKNDSQTIYDLGGNCLDIMKAIEDKDNRRNPKSLIPPPMAPSPPNPCQNVIGTCDF